MSQNVVNKIGWSKIHGSNGSWVGMLKGGWPPVTIETFLPASIYRQTIVKHFDKQFMTRRGVVGNTTMPKITFSKRLFEIYLSSTVTLVRYSWERQWQCSNYSATIIMLLVVHSNIRVPSVKCSILARFVTLPTYLPTYLPIYLPTYLSIYLPMTG